ncbi:Fic family protein [Corynebacterium sp. HMSC074A09]|uniref:Fic family protein n=1 Tax=Corynebacterium sp. HMSC074A09 TaxID=1739311 RepID=UPI0008A48423|nr:Fic family protein [Corynebacterium sp. HMSC074A09]OFK68905.1 DNA-binding protein [Corynebacterium sp. HMSC074A09]
MAKTVELEWIPADGSGLSRRAKQGGKYHAFVPDPLAGMSLKLPSELSRRIVRIEREIHNLGMRDNTHSLEGVARLLLRSEAVASSRIEGIAPNSDKVAMAILARESDSGIRGFKESATAVARNVAILDTINADLAYKDELVLDDIVAMQTALVAEKPLQGVRTTQNWIGGSDYHPIDAAFVPPPPVQVPELLDDLIEYFNGADHAALVQAALVHAQFETIHPFPDGNGRVGRAMIHALLQRRGLTDAAVLPVSMVLATLGDRYVDGLTKFREGDVLAWISFFVEAAQVATTKAAELADSVAALEAEWMDKVNHHRTAQGSKRALKSNSTEFQLLKKLPAMPLVTVSIVKSELGISSTSTARDALDSLTEAGILRKKVIGAGGLLGYFADDVFMLVDDAERQLASTQFNTQLSPPTGRAVPALRDK